MEADVQAMLASKEEAQLLEIHSIVIAAVEFTEELERYPLCQKWRKND